MQENSLIKKNILKYIEYKGITKYKFYQQTGITRGILDQNNGMSEENTLKFLAYFSEVNTEWLFSGKGKMIKSETNPTSASVLERETREDMTSIDRMIETADRNARSIEKMVEVAEINAKTIQVLLELLIQNGIAIPEFVQSIKGATDASAIA